MSLIVEDGTGKVDAESFASVTAADTYHSNRGNTAWAAIATTALKEAALRKASDYMGQIYGPRWKGYRVGTAQALDWPRTGVERPGSFGPLGFASYYAVTDMPAPVVNACCELALRAAAAELAADQGQNIAAVKAGSVEITYADHSDGRKAYPAVDRTLAPLLNGGSGQISLAKS